MVRWLVAKRHLAVDVRGEGTGMTPLMAVVTRCCVPFGGPGDAHSAALCCREPHAGSRAASLGVRTSSLHPTARLLVALGADLRAVDVSGSCLLAVAAAAGVDGMWPALLAAQHSILPRHTLDCVPAHAGIILDAVVAAQGSLDVASEQVSAAFALHSVRWLHREYRARGWVERWETEVNAPVTRPTAEFAMPSPPERVTTGALLQAARWEKPESMRAMLQLLLEVGCQPRSLLSGPAIEGLTLASWWVIARWTAQHPGEHNGDGKVVMILLAAAARKAPSAGEYAEAIRALAQHGGTIKKCALCYEYGDGGEGAAVARDGQAEGVAGADDVPFEYVNLLHRTVQCDTLHALAGVCQVSE